MFWLKLRCWLCKFFGRSYKATVCGHKTKLIGRGKIFEEEYISTFEKGKIKYCRTCLGAMAIRCAWCGEPILTGEPITLYAPSEDFIIPSYAVLYEEKGGVRLVGCLRWDCADTGADRSGFWVIPGKVFRTISAFEIALVIEKGVLCADLDNEPFKVIESLEN